MCYLTSNSALLWRTRRASKRFKRVLNPATLSLSGIKAEMFLLDSNYPGQKVRCMEIVKPFFFVMARIHSKRTKASLLLAACDGRCKMGDVGRPLFQGGSLLRCAAFAANRAFFHSPPSGVRIQRLAIIKQLRLKRCGWCLSITASRCGG